MGQEKTIISISDQRLREAIYDAFEGKCFYTGQHVSKNEMHIDHVRPVSKGGEDSIFNYVLTSQKMNLRKGNKIDPSKIERILYIISTVYAPKVLKFLGMKRKKPQKELSGGNDKIAISMREWCSIWFKLGFHCGQTTLINHLSNPNNFTMNSEESFETLEERMFKEHWKDDF